MTDLIQDAAKVASAASSASGVASAVEGVVSTAAGGLLTSFLPYILGALGLVAASGWGIAAFQHYVTVPHYESVAATAKADLQSANAATAEANSNTEALRTTVQRQNQQIAGLQADAQAKADAANKAASAVVKRPLPAPPADKSADAVNAYLQSLRTSP